MTQKPTTRQDLLAAARAELAENGEDSLGLRAVARRAGLSHAAPAYFFGNRSGLLTAVATDGFLRLTEALDDALAGDEDPLTAVGHAYIAFGAQNPSLIDLMFQGRDLIQDDPELQSAKRAAIGRLAGVVAGRTSDAVPWTLVSWALVHGLVVLARERALAAVAGEDAGTDLDVARNLIDLYSRELPR